jgi:hypothetical protein
MTWQQMRVAHYIYNGMGSNWNCSTAHYESNVSNQLSINYECQS